MSIGEPPAAQTSQDALTYEAPRVVATPAAEIGAIALRLLGAKVLVDLLSELPLIATFLMAGGGPASAVPQWAVVAVTLAWHAALAAVLVFAARPLAEVIFGRRTVGAYDVGTAAWMALVVSGIGLALALFSAGEAAAAIVALVNRVRMNVGPTMPTEVEGAELIRLVAPIAKAALGIVLFLNPSLLAAPWLRRATTDSTPAKP